MKNRSENKSCVHIFVACIIFVHANFFHFVMCFVNYDPTKNHNQ